MKIKSYIIALVIAATGVANLAFVPSAAAETYAGSRGTGCTTYLPESQSTATRVITYTYYTQTNIGTNIRYRIIASTVSSEGTFYYASPYALKIYWSNGTVTNSSNRAYIDTYKINIKPIKVTSSANVRSQIFNTVISGSARSCSAYPTFASVNVNA